MTLGTILDVIIGLAFTYFLLALIASGIQEVIAGVFQWRGTYLAKGIAVILDNAPDAAFRWNTVRDFIAAHFTRSIPPAPAAPQPAFAAADAPPADQTATAMRRLQAVQSHPLIRGAPSALPSYVSSRNFALALLEALRDGSQLPLIVQSERTIALLPDGDLKRTLSLFLQNAGGDLDAFRAHVEKWFDDAMDRLSGIYTRISHYGMIILGLALALSMNVDSVRLARTLWQDPLLSGHVADHATATATGPAPTASGAAPGSPDMAATLETLDAQGLPIGWSGATSPHGGAGTIIALCGWLFTAAAVALGAPFWFSLLQQLTNIRNAGPKPDPSTADTAPRGTTTRGS